MRANFKLCREGAKAPVYQTEGASGLDLYAHAILWPKGIEQPPETNFPYVLMPGDGVMVWSGVAFSIPEGWELQVRPRSSSSKQLVHVCLGTIDSDYRGELGFQLINLSSAPFAINKGDRLAQVVFVPVGRFELQEVEQLDETKRGTSGIGSTGR